MSSEWGRIDADGTVYVRTTDGERVIGSWHAGSLDDGIDFYVRRYTELEADVALLEGRIGSDASDPAAVAEAARKLQEVIPSAAVMGDLDTLMGRLLLVLGKVEERLAAKKVERAKAAEAAADQKRALVAEANKLAESKSWKASGERFRAIVEEWKAIRGVDRKIDSGLWSDFSKARRQFDARRRAHFAELEQTRGATAEVKSKLCVEAEKLAQSTDWGPTSKRFRDLMTEWKAAGRASREVDDELWKRFKAAQDTFFAKRSEVFSARDDEQKTNLEAKRALLEEAKGLDASKDPEGARKRLRVIHEKWEKIGHVPRDAKDKIEDQLAEVESKIRDTSSAKRTFTVTESPLVIRLRESVGKLEARLARAQAAGDAKLVKETEESLVTQREWLAQAESAS